MTNYQVFVTPLKSSGAYGTEVEISNWVITDDFTEVTRSIDLTDYNLGIYAHSDVTLVCDASDGYLNDQNDSRSIFQFSRDLAKVRFVFLKDGTPLTTFNGVINEDGSSTDATAETVSLVIMGNDSILSKSLVAKDAVSDGLTFSQAFIAILNSAVGGVLHVDALNIAPVYDGIVDIGKSFDNLTAKDALDKLLLPSNSILTIDDSNNVYVNSRQNKDNPTLFLFGKGDLFGRENINLLENYNNGLQRTFNLIRVTGAQAPAVDGMTPESLVGVAQDEISIGFYGLRLKEVSVDFVTDQTTLDEIAAAILAEFKFPKCELEVTIPTELVQAQVPPTDLLDLVSVNYPLVVRPLPNCRLPIIGITSIGDVTAPLPYVEGALSIDSSVAWKVIEIRENPNDFTSVLKLRVIGSGPTDGSFVFLQTEDGLNIETESGENLTI